MFALLAEMAGAERETLSERIKSGLEEAKRKGHRLGRPAGASLFETQNGVFMPGVGQHPISSAQAGY